MYDPRLTNLSCYLLVLIKQMPSLQTNVWGPPQWLIAHLLPLTYPENPDKETRAKFAKRFLSIFETLPCSICINNVPKNVAKLGVGTPKQLPSVKELAATPYFESSETLFYFTFRLHNEVNLMLGKVVVPDSDYGRVKRQYELAYAKSSACDQKDVKERGCTIPEDGYHPCMSRIALVPRSLGTETHGPAFYFDVSLKNDT
jgi:hypothetical protein